MLKLNFSPFDARLKKVGQKTFIYDTIRKKWMQLTPEEWVRQHVVNWLKEDMEVPAGLISVEGGLKFDRLRKRTDIVVYGSDMKPLLIVECKAPEVMIGQDTFDQVARYNFVHRARYLMVSNGLDHYFCEMRYNPSSYTFLPSLPKWGEWLKN